MSTGPTLRIGDNIALGLSDGRIDFEDPDDDGSRLELSWPGLDAITAAMQQGATPGQREHRAMRKFAIFTATALLISASLAGPARADESPSSNTTHYSGACDQSARQSHSNATCLHAWWDNTPSTHAGSDFGAKNLCSSYGTVVAHVDKKDAGDYHFHLLDDSEENSNSWFTDVREISCCVDKSDLCFKEQVEANSSGKIYHVVLPTYTWVSVATHQERYDFCQANPDYIYCTVDPKGDALQNPATMPGDCDGSPCTIQDCRDRFALSSAAGSPSSCTDLSLRYPDWPGDPNRSYDNRPDDEWTLSDEECWVRHARECTAEDGSQKTADMMDADTGETTWDAGTDYIAVDAVDMNDLLYCESWREDNCQTGGCYKDYRLVYGACPDDDDTTTSTATTTGSN